MAQLPEAGVVTGTADKDYNLLWFTETCLSNALRLETYIEDARRVGDDKLADLFLQAQQHAIRGAESGKSLLRDRIAG
jgi:hypothetical protein